MESRDCRPEFLPLYGNRTMTQTLKLENISFVMIGVVYDLGRYLFDGRIPNRITRLSNVSSRWCRLDVQGKWLQRENVPAVR